MAVTPSAIDRTFDRLSLAVGIVPVACVHRAFDVFRAHEFLTNEERLRLFLKQEAFFFAFSKESVGLSCASICCVSHNRIIPE